jgi:serine phosphatase RsbU (regulator of sigma subunit)
MARSPGRRTTPDPALHQVPGLRDLVRLLDGMTTAHALVGPDGRVLHANRAFCLALGRTAADDLAGASLDALFGTALLVGGALPASRSETAVQVGAPGEPRVLVVNPVELTVSVAVVELLAGAQAGAVAALDAAPLLPGSSELQARLVEAETQAVRVHAVATALARALTVADVVDVMSREVHPALGGDGMQIGLLDDRGRLELVHVQGYSRTLIALVEDMLPKGVAALAEVAHTGAPILFASPEEYLARYPDRRDVVEASNKGSWAFLPLTASGRTLGAWCVGFRRPGQVTPSRLALMALLAGLCAQAFERARLYEREAETALRLQEALAPGRLPVLPGLTLAGRHVPSGRAALVGGDFYDAVRVDDRSVVLAVGDVAGHGIEASASMSQLRTMLRVFAAEGRSPGHALESANALLSAATTSTMATCALLRLDVVTGTARLSVAGHPPPVLLPHDGPARLLEVPPRLPLGCDPIERYTEHRVVLGHGDILLLYTDGLVESRAQSLDEGLEALLRLRRQEPGALVDELISEVRPADGDDDVAVLAVRLDGDV